jgi:hypothetical protein
MAITAAADKTTAAFFMGFPFTKIKRQAKPFCRLNPVTLCPLLVPSRGTSNPNKKTANRKFVPAKYEIVNFMSPFDSGPLIQSRRLRNSKISQGVQFHFLEGCIDMRDLGAVVDHEEPPAPSGERAIASQDHQHSVVMRRRNEPGAIGLSSSRAPRGSAERAPLNSPPCRSLRCPLCST